jgi:uncharacterized Zn finger protein (UPF0148 family)
MHDPKGRRCDCGKPAFKWKSGDWVCERCDRLEKQIDAMTTQTKGRHKTEMITTVFIFDEYSPICGASLLWLEKLMMKGIV